MPCFYPMWRKIPFTGEVVRVPCGYCRGCRMDKAKAWALRCVHEAQMHDENCFVTLTYNPENLPSDGSVSKREMQLFMKRLRKSVNGKEVRFYGCGEYGSKLGRPHYHLLLFGYDFPDKEIFYVEESKRSRFDISGSYKVFKSAMLARLWEKGFSSLGEVSFESAGYCARYVGKKIGGKMALEHYKGKEPEFALMSRRPGIGSTWFDKYKSDVYEKDFTTVKGRKFKPPLFYDRRLMRADWDMYERIKEERKSRAVTPDCIRRRQKEKYLINVTQSLDRRLEHE